MVRSGFTAGIVALALVVSSCERGFVSVTAQAPPGAVLRVQTRTNLQNQKHLSATVGDKPALVRVIDERTADVLVPWLDPGEAALVLTAGKREIGRAKVTILDTATRRVQLSIDRDGIELQRVERSADDTTPNVRSNRRRISFDLVNDRDGLIYSGSVLHPLSTGGEVITARGSDQPAIASRIEAPDSTTFSLNIPRPPQGAVLRVYDVPPGVDITTPDGREQRILIRSLAL